MTREIRVNERTTIAARTGNGSSSRVRANVTSRKNDTIQLVLGNAACFCHKVCHIKKAISEKITTVAEDLADKTAREGLFGEDRGKGYAGTDVDYIER